MTWQWVVLIVGVLAFVGWESYVSMLKERTAIAARTLAITEDSAMSDYERSITNGHP